MKNKTLNNNTDLKYRLNILNMFNIVFISFLIPLSINAFYTGYHMVALNLAINSVILMFNYFYLKRTQNVKNASLVVSILFSCMLLFLVYTGGVSNTGVLWIYALPPVLLYLHGYTLGLKFVSLFSAIMLFMLFFPYADTLGTEYTDAFKVRVILSFLLVVLLSSVYESINQKTLIRMQNLQKDLTFFLRRDELTGLFNRRGYNDNTNKIISSSGVIMMCDIDNLKKINDTYGHSAGDYVIQKVASCIRNNIRKEDIAVRWGGEEFLVFLSETNINNAYFTSEKIRKMIENTSIDYQKQRIKITISIGISVVNEIITLNKAIKNADNAMYNSKALGRNKTSKYV